MGRITTIALGFYNVFLFACLTPKPDVAVVSAFSRTGPGLQNRPRRCPVDGTALASTNGPSGGDFGELTSALVTLDQQWQMQQQSGRGKPRWSKLFLPPEDPEDGGDESETLGSKPRGEDFVWMLEPPSSSIPSCVVVFTGGAGLGQFPQVVYNELLTKVSDKLNAVCITAPYEVGLDHFSLAKETGERIRRALLVLNDDEDAKPLPTYSLAHSLGCKLQTIYMAATGLESSFDGIGFMAFNNFSFAKTITMARSFAQELRGGGGMPSASGMGGVNPEMINSIFDFAEMAVGAIGVDFSPSPQDTQRLIQLRYSESMKAKTRLFVFGDDTLDSSQEFRDACESGVGVSNLPGGHLTPVYFQFKVDDLAGEAMGGLGDNFTPENINMAKEAIGGFQGASFGDEENFSALADEVCDWILGKPPTAASIPRISSGGADS
ncbi:unnamed protein product [Pseudo-nitzschia multistriata]|uniref:Uncharacterized protein n=1 Tax=Pseudo-nitzschia multistriata TaxID=183589 RepID=A0A448YUB0_9STRA|nr:unnamed protein product [Pseudo-nitzschia multistriata]